MARQLFAMPAPYVAEPCVRYFPHRSMALWSDFCSVVQAVSLQGKVHVANCRNS